MNPLPILRDSWYFFSRNLAAIALLCLPLIVLEGLAQLAVTAWSGSAASPAHGLLVGLLFYPLYTAALILFLDARSRGLQPRTADLLAMALRLWPSFAVLAALSTLLIMLGVSLFVLPGLWVMIKLAFAEYLLVLRGLTPLAALRESFQLTTGHFWRILLCILSVMLPLWLLDWLSFPTTDQQPDALLSFVLDCTNGFLQLFASVVLFRLFMLVSQKPADA
ncbi:YciC family protein [Pseudomonas sp. 2FE]|uniref:YciC family protein n=1 Tax=Pseudomonas sp. 2FE TaxID=2502190 RepID=UPI0010F59B01|nr:YciC family protein [Pseudomonas sp. 2FE]